MSLGLSNNNDDAALIDSYFLPGGILDPDEEEEEEEDKPLTARISPSWPLVMSRVPSNPWCDQEDTPDTETRHGNPSQPHEVQGPTVHDTGRLHSSQQKKEISGNPLHLKPPPGYQMYQETDFNFPISTNPPEFHLHNTHAQSDTSEDHPAESQRSRLNPSSPGPIDVPHLAWQDRTIRRPGRHTAEAALATSSTSKHLSNTSHNHNGEYVHHQVVVGGHHEAGYSEFQGLGISKSYSYSRRPREQSDTFGDGTDHESSHSAIRSYDGSFGDLLKVVSSERATSMEGSDFQMNEEEMENNNDREGEDEHDEEDDDEDDDDDDDDGEADDIEESSEEELPFPLEEFDFVSNSKEDPDSMISSLSTSSSSSLDAHDSHVGLDENEYEQSIQDDDPLDVDRPQADPDSAVAVILDFSATVEGNETIQTSSNVDDENEHKSSSLDTNKHSEAQNHVLLSETTQIAVTYDELPVARSEAEIIHSSQSSSMECHSKDTAAPNLYSRFKVWYNNFQEYLAWMDDLHQAVAMVLSTTWALLSMFTYWGMKFLLISSLLLIQGGKYAFFQVIEEPQVTISYAIFYLMPSFCSLLRAFFAMPHWTPHFLTSLAVWSLCTQIPAGPLSLDNYTISGYVRHINRRQLDFSPPVPRSRDERACHNILRVLRFVLPLFFFADGFSTEFGTIMGVSGSSRLTTAFMMSLVRKNLVSSPVGWVSWAIQVLLVTHHHSSPLVDAFVLMAGLSSLRLIRYLDALRASNKRKQGKEH